MLTGVVERLFAEDLMGDDKLFDATAARAQVSAIDVAQLSETLKKIGHVERLDRCAIVVADHLLLALVRTLGGGAASVADIRPFHSQAEAEEWPGWGQERASRPATRRRRKKTASVK
jgi:hypothetical protein